jgi:hypothetical protein
MVAWQTFSRAAMLNVYFIPEPVLRSLPDHIPGHPRIRIRNCQGPVGPDDPTPSTYSFDKGRLQIVLQIVDVQPRQSTKPDRTWFFVLLERKKKWLGLLQNRFRSSVRNYLQGIGAADTGQDLSDYLAKLPAVD